MKRRNKEFDNLIIYKYYNLRKNMLSISKELKCSRNTIINILNENKVPIRKVANNKIDIIHFNDIVVLYLRYGYKAKDIAKKYNVSISTILNFLRKNKIVIRKRKNYNKYTCNESFFENIDTESKAYFLGLLYADGNISNKNQTNIRLTLIEDDKHILEQFKKELNYQCPLSFHKSNNQKQKNTLTLYICNYKIKESLIKQGCIPKKSLILKFPTEEQVPYNLIHHFIRGYFDGDGCISLSGTPTFSILSTKNVVSNINNIFNKEIGIGLKNLELHPNGINMQYRISGQKQIIKVFKYLYKDANFFLKRKFNKFQQFLQKEDLSSY